MGKWIQIEKDTYIRALNCDKKLKLIKAENIGISPNKSFFRTTFASQIDYKSDNDYELEATMIFGKLRKYDKNNSEWR